MVIAQGKGPSTAPTFVIVNRMLSLRETLPIPDFLRPQWMVPGEFMALFKTKEHINELIAKIISRTDGQLMDEIRREERLSLREEKKRPWSFKTRRPFRGRIQRVTPTLREQLAIAEEVASELGPPWKPSKKGRPPKYGPEKLGAVLMVKGTKSFDRLASGLRNIRYDATLKNTGDSPCASELHWAFTKMPSEWLEKALARLDERSVELYHKFDGNMEVFGIDGSALQGDHLEEIQFRMVPRLIRETYSYGVLSRLPTNTIRGMKGHTRKIEPFLPLLAPGALLLCDAEYDVEENYRLARENSIDLQVKQKKGGVRSPFRKKARREYSARKYRRRKLCERIFGNLEVRGYRCYYKRKDSRHKGVLLMGCAHNIIGYFKNKAWCDQFDTIMLSRGHKSRGKKAQLMCTA